MKVTVVGLGLIGGSLAKDILGLGLAREIIGVEENKAHAEKALNLNLVAKTLPLDQAVRDADLVVLAIPVNAIEQVLPIILGKISDKTVVTDMGSTKEAICKSAGKSPRRNQFVAAHPMAGTENSGPDAAIAGLFTHKTAVICEKEKSSAQALAVVGKIFEGLRMRVVYMNPKEHDLHAAYVSHLSHISSFVLANTVLDKEKNAGAIFDLAGGGFESTVRLAKSSPEMWAPIFEQNKSYVSQALSDYIDHLTAFKASIDKEDREKLKVMMEGANEIRRVLSQMAQRLKKE